MSIDKSISSYAYMLICSSAQHQHHHHHPHKHQHQHKHQHLHQHQFICLYVHLLICIIINISISIIISISISIRRKKLISKMSWFRPADTVLRVPCTPHGVLAAAVKVVVDEEAGRLGLKMKTQEGSGLPLKRSVVTSDLEQISYLSFFLHLENFWINFSPH